MNGLNSVTIFWVDEEKKGLSPRTGQTKDCCILLDRSEDDGGVQQRSSGRDDSIPLQ